jgi:hypothetical protein
VEPETAVPGAHVCPATDVRGSADAAEQSARRMASARRPRRGCDGAMAWCGVARNGNGVAPWRARAVVVPDAAFRSGGESFIIGLGSAESCTRQERGRGDCLEAWSAQKSPGRRRGGVSLPTSASVPGQLMNESTVMSCHHLDAGSPGRRLHLRDRASEFGYSVHSGCRRLLAPTVAVSSAFTFAACPQVAARHCTFHRPSRRDVMNWL